MKMFDSIKRKIVLIVVLSEEALFTSLWHEEIENAECHCRDRGEEEESSVETEMLHNRAGDHLTERSANESQGVRLAMMQNLARYCDGYDWRKIEGEGRCVSERRGGDPAVGPAAQPGARLGHHLDDQSVRRGDRATARGTDPNALRLRASFYLLGVLGGVWSAVWNAWLRNSPREMRGISRIELREIGRTETVHRGSGVFQ
jgi:hypothetical protein